MCIEVRKLKVRPEKKAESPTVTSKQNVTVSSATTVLTKSSRSTNSPFKRKGFKDSTGQFLLFVTKVVALEAIRRGSQGKCRPIWWGLQGLSVFQAPPFSWLQRWAPFRILAHATEVSFVTDHFPPFFVCSCFWQLMRMCRVVSIILCQEHWLVCGNR